MASAYTGAATRAHYSRRPPVPGVSPEHTHPDPEVDVFAAPPAGGPSTGSATIWEAPDESVRQSGQPSRAPLPITHWWPGPAPIVPAVPDGYTRREQQQAVQNRMVGNHVFADVIPDSARTYSQAGEGRSITRVVGIAPREAGIGVPDNASFLVAGSNGFDFTNQPNEVYQGDPANVGRYRLGYDLWVYGIYGMPMAKNGLDTHLRAHTGQAPILPRSRAVVENPTPYSTGFLSGTNTAPARLWQVPSMFAAPSDTTITDQAIAGGGAGNSDFIDDGEFL